MDLVLKSSKISDVQITWMPDAADHSTDQVLPPMPWIDQTIQFYLDLIGIPQDPDVEMYVRIDGRQIGREEWKYTFVQPGARMDIVRFPNGLGALIVTGFWLALGYTVTGAGVVIAGIAIDLLIGTGLAYLASLFQEKPGLSSQDAPKFTYGAGGINTGTALGLPIPIIYGEHIVGGHLIDATVGHISGVYLVRPYYQAIRSGQRTRLTLGISEGPIQEICGYTSDTDFQWFNKLAQNALLWSITPNFNSSQFKSVNINDQAGYERMAFSFKTGLAARTLSSITIALKSHGSPLATSSVNVRLETSFGTGLNAQPSGVPVGETMTKLVGEINPTGHTYQKFVPAFPINLPAQAIYWVVIEVTYTQSATNYISMGYWTDVIYKPGSSNIKRGNQSSPYSWNFLTPYVPNVSGADEQMVGTVSSEAESFTGFGTLKINGSEIESFSANGYMGTRMGKLWQEPIPGESGLSFEQPTAVSLPIGKTQLVGTTTSGVNGFGLVFTFPEGWYKSGNNSLSPALFNVTVAWRPEGESYDWDSLVFQDFMFFGKPDAITVRVDFSLRKNTPVQPGTTVEIRATQNLTKDFVQFEVRAESIKEYGDQDAQTHPHLAMLYLDSDVPSATGTIDNVTFKVKGKVMHYYDNGTWRYGYTDNPSHCCLDLILNERYGGGSTMTLDNVDLDAFQDWADFCDELIFDGENWIKRFQLAIVIDEEKTWWDWCKQIASVSRCKLLPIGNKIKPKVDRLRDMTQVLTAGNIVEDSLVIRYLPKRKRANKVIVEFLNADNNYAFETVEEEDPSVRENEEDLVVETVSMFGITNVHRARRQAKYLLNLNQKVTFGGECKAFIDMVNSEPGDVIGVASDIPDWDQVSGRILENAPAGSFKADHPFTYEDTGDPYRVTVWTTDDSTGQRVINTRTIPLPSPVPTTYDEGDVIPVELVWPSNQYPKQNDPYSIRRIRNLVDVSVPTAEPAVLKVQVIDMELTEDYEVLLRFMEYRDEIFDDEPGSTKRDDEVPQNLNEDVPPAPIGLQIFPFLESRTGKYAARIEYRAAVVPGVKEYRIAVLYRIQNYAGDFQRSSMDAFSNHTSCLFRGGDDGEGLIPGLTYEVALAPISPTTGLHFGGFSDRVARTVQTIPKAYWTLAGSLAQQIVIRT